MSASVVHAHRPVIARFTPSGHSARVRHARTREADFPVRSGVFAGPLHERDQRSVHRRPLPFLPYGLSDLPASARLDRDREPAPATQDTVYALPHPHPRPPPTARPIEPLRIQDEARALAGTNVIVSGRFKPHAVRDGNLITGQPVYSGAPASRHKIEVLGA
jgi:hypothetical protein